MRPARPAALALLLAICIAPTVGGEPIAIWGFDETSGQTIYDESPNGLHGFLGSQPEPDAEDPQRIPGLDGSVGALRMDGMGFAQVPNSPLLQPAGSLTVIALIRPSVDWQRRRIVTNVERLGENLYSGFNFDVQGDTLRFQIFSATGEENFVMAEFDFVAGTVYEVAGSWDQSRSHLDVFVNGESLHDFIVGGSADTTIAQIGPNSGNLFIGATSFGPSELFLGDIDHVRLYSTPLSDPGGLGACCVRPVGEEYCVCIGDHTVEICELVGGVWDAAASCNDPAYTCPCGACCRGADCEFGYARDCDELYMGDGSSCGPPNPCVGACCTPDGLCVDTPPAECEDGIWYEGQSCDAGGFECPPFGACCVPGEACRLDAEWQCTAADGVYLGDGVACGPPDPCFGCCCDDYTGLGEDGVAIGACPPEQRFGAGLSCAELEPPCGILGACCVVGACLADVVESTCDLLGGQWYEGQYCDCTLADCRGDHLPADSNCDGVINVFDIDPFVLALTNRCAWLALYGDQCSRCCVNDINGDGFVNAFDIDPFVQCLVGGGCPTGACCLPYGCEVLTQAACMAAGGWQWLEGQGCEPDPCPPPPDMVLIPAGEFMMGDTFDEGYSQELPVHAVYVDAFYMDTYEVTNAQYASGLNWAWAQGGLITVTNGVVYQAGSGMSFPYCDTTTSSSFSRITWDGSTFGVVSGKENHPMAMVSWYGAVAYCNWRSAMEGKPLCYDLSTWTCNFGAGGYRLPTEAEWEKAARGGTPGHRLPWSDQDTIQHARANYRSTGWSYDTSPTSGYHPLWGVGSTPYTSPVGFFDGSLQYKADWGWPGDATSYQTASGANGYGLHDMAGNVLELCHDWFSDTYYRYSPYYNPTGQAGGSTRVLRGGSWFDYASGCRVAYRSNVHPGDRYGGNGFRLALGTPATTGACCLPDGCEVLTQAACMAGGADWLEGLTCEPDQCSPTGACCLPDGCEVLTQAACMAAGGWQWLEGLTCEPDPCPPTGACCLADGCQVRTAAECVVAGGWWHEGLTCEADPCTATGACCLADGCEVLTSAACMVAGGWWLEGATCEAKPCPEAPAGMVLIPGGWFMMGDTFGEGWSDELPVHAVHVDAFHMGVYEVTNAEYAAGLNWALAEENLITVSDGVVYQHGSGTDFPYCSTTSAPSRSPDWGERSRITWDGSTFGVVAGKESHPMVMVTWYGSAAYCNWRSAMESKPLCYDLSTWSCNFGVGGYRLPTEAEWEKAARGGTPGHRLPWSDQDTIQRARANYQSYWMGGSPYDPYDTSPTSGFHPCWGVGSPPYTSPVGFFDGSLQYKADWGWPGDGTSYQTASGANGYGLHDMAGNVFEWCHDWYSSTYYSSSPYDDPTGPASGTWRVSRGGSWNSRAYYCRVACRCTFSPGYRHDYIGFRLALEIP
jgi:formylglycine-generating enzyme required for sulfatase activity